MWAYRQTNISWLLAVYFVDHDSPHGGVSQKVDRETAWQNSVCCPCRTHGGLLTGDRYCASRRLLLRLGQLTFWGLLFEPSRAHYAPRCPRTEDGLW